jgi:hypothetical protein
MACLGSALHGMDGERAQGFGLPSATVLLVGFVIWHSRNRRGVHRLHTQLVSSDWSAWFGCQTIIDMAPSYTYFGMSCHRGFCVGGWEMGWPR